MEQFTNYFCIHCGHVLNTTKKVKDLLECRYCGLIFSKTSIEDFCLSIQELNNDPDEFESVEF